MTTMKWSLRDATIAVKVAVGLTAFFIATGIPALFYFYDVNAWAQDVQQSEQRIVADQNREILEGKLALAKVRVVLYLSIQEKRTLTPIEELELEIAKSDREIAAKALIEAKKAGAQ